MADSQLSKLTITFQDIQCKEDVKDIRKCYCLIAIDQDNFGRTRLAQSLASIIQPLQDSDIQIVINSDDSGTPIGSIKFSSAKLLPHVPGELSLWYSLSMDTFDNYNGNFKDDQLALPRIKLTFKVEKASREVKEDSRIDVLKEKLVEEATLKLAAMDKEEKEQIEGMKKKLGEIEVVVNTPKEPIKGTSDYLAASNKVLELSNKLKSLEEDLKLLKGVQEQADKLSVVVSQKESNEVLLNKKEQDLKGNIETLNKLNKDAKERNEGLNAKILKTQEQVNALNSNLGVIKASTEKAASLAANQHSEDIAKIMQLQRDVSSANDVVNQCSIQLVANKKDLSDLNDKFIKIKSEKDALNLEKCNLIEAVNELKVKLEKSSLAKGRCEGDITSLEGKLNNTLNSIEDERRSMQAQISELSNKNKELKEKEAALSKKLEEANDEALKIRRDYAKQIEEIQAKSTIDIENEKKNSAKYVQMLSLVENQNKELKQGQAKYEVKDLLSTSVAELITKLEELMNQRIKCTVTIRILTDKVQSQFGEIENIEKQLKKSEEENAKLNQKLKDTEHQLETMSHTKDSLNKELTENRALNDRLNESLNSAKIKIAELESIIKEKDVEITGFKLQIKNYKEEIVRLNQIIESKDREIANLIAKMEENDRKYKEEIAQREAVINDLTIKLNAALREIAALEEKIIAYEKLIAELKERLRNKDFEDLPLPEVPVYDHKAMDAIDEELMKYMEKYHCPVMFRRIGEGIYMFGTKKVFAKIMNERLVIRVGGGYMMIDQFLNAYTEIELKKMNDLKARQEAGQLSSSSSSSLQKSSPISPGKKNSSNFTSNMMASEVIAEDRGAMHSAFSKINGTSRVKPLTEAELRNSKHVGAKKSCDPPTRSPHSEQ